MKRIKMLTAVVAVAFVLIGSAFTKVTTADYRFYAKQVNSGNPALLDVWVIDESAVGQDEFIACEETAVNQKCQVSISGSPSFTDEGDLLKTTVAASSVTLFGTADKRSTIEQE